MFFVGDRSQIEEVDVVVGVVADADDVPGDAGPVAGEDVGEGVVGGVG